MESQYKSNSIGGLESADTNSREVAIASKMKPRRSDLVLRFLALALCLTAAVVLGVDRQTTTVALTLVPTLPPVNIPVTAKWRYLSANVYFVVANAVACAYAAISLLLALTKRVKKGVALMIVILDLMMVALLFSSFGAAVAIGIMGYEGNSHVRWDKVCNVFGRFCNQAAAALAISGVASLLFFLLVVLATLNLQKRLL